MTYRRASLSIVVALLLAPAASFAQQQTPAVGAPAPLSSSLTGQAKADYDAAKALYDIGDFRGAAIKFARAFERSQDPRLLWNMAACEKESHRYANAVKLVEGYLKSTDPRITAEARANAASTLTALQGLYSEVAFTSVPAQTKIFVDDELVATAPLESKLPLDVGTRRLRLEHPDFAPWAKTIEVSGGQDEAIAVDMRPLPNGRVVITAGAGDTIVFDGKVVATGRWESRAEPGRHVVRVTAVGKRPYEAALDLAPEATRTVQVTLEDPKRTPLWPFIVGGAVLAGGAAVGGYFLFKPEDKPGSYQEGALGTVIVPGSFR